MTLLGKAALPLFAGAILSACAWQEGVRPAWTLHETDFTAIQTGTEEADVERRLGKPILTTRFARLEEEVWDYRYMFGVQTYVGEVHFNLQGRVKRIEHYPDRCPMRAVPCR